MLGHTVKINSTGAVPVFRQSSGTPTATRGHSSITAVPHAQAASTSKRSLFLKDQETELILSSTALAENKFKKFSVYSGG
jgi:hypothetical protein